MAELRIDRDDGSPPGGRPGETAPGASDPTLRSRVAPTDHLLPERTGGAAPGGIETDDPDAARARIEQTRARMSSTIDEIEDVLVRKKARLQERLDVTAPIREHPLRSVGAVFLGGLVLGFLTGGSDDDEGDEGHYLQPTALRAGDAYWRERSRTWESRARRLKRIAREQEAELAAIGLDEPLYLDEDHDDDDEAGLDGTLGEFGQAVMATVAGALASFFSEARARGADLRDELGDRGHDLSARAHDAADTARDRGRSAMKKARSRGEHAMDATRDRAGDLIDAARDRAEDLMDAARDRADDVKDAASGVRDRAEDLVDRGKDRLDSLT